MSSVTQQLGRTWPLFVVTGTLCVITGVLAVVWPDLTLLTLGIFAGIYLIAAAVMEITDAIVGDPGGRGLSALLGILSLIAGLIFLRRPGESLLAIVVVAGVFLVAEGVIRVIRAFGPVTDRWWGVAAALVDIVIGGLILALPKLGLVTLTIFFGATMIVRGAFAILIGLRLRRANRSADPLSVPAPASYA